MSDDKVEWINGKHQIEGATEASLKRSLLTCDGAGTEIKKMCLDELLKREYVEAYDDARFNNAGKIS